MKRNQSYISKVEKINNKKNKTSPPDVTILSLSNEVLEFICSKLQINEIKKLQQTCKAFSTIGFKSLSVKLEHLIQKVGLSNKIVKNIKQPTNISDLPIELIIHIFNFIKADLKNDIFEIYNELDYIHFSSSDFVENQVWTATVEGNFPGEENQSIINLSQTADSLRFAFDTFSRKFSEYSSTTKRLCDQLHQDRLLPERLRLVSQEWKEIYDTHVSSTSRSIGP